MVQFDVEAALCRHFSPPNGEVNSPLQRQTAPRLLRGELLQAVGAAMVLQNFKQRAMSEGRTA